MNLRAVSAERLRIRGPSARSRTRLRERPMMAISTLIASLGVWYGAPARAASFEVYGIADAAVGYARNEEGDAQFAVRSGQASSSRLGLRGREPLTGKMEALFNLETSIDVDTGHGGGSREALGWNRQSWIGLAGDYGAVTLGRQYRPETRAVFVMDPFDGSSVASPPNTYSELVYRVDNAAVYETPRVANWQALVMFAPGERPDGVRSARDDRGFALLYHGGPLNLAYGWDRRANAQADDDRVWQSLGGSYDLGKFTVYGAYRRRAEGAAEVDERSYWMGLSVPLGSFTLRGVLGAVNDRSADNEDATGLGIGLDYALSKRTDIYSRLAMLRNRNGAGFDFGDNTAGKAPRSFAVGMRLRF